MNSSDLGIAHFHLTSARRVIVITLLAVAMLIATSLRCLGETTPQWDGMAIRTTDLLPPSTEHGRYMLGQASVMTSNGCHVAKGEGSPLDGCFVRRDGKPGRRYDSVANLVFSQKGNSLAYVAKKGKACLVVVNEREDREFSVIAVDWLALSPSGAHHAYLAWEAGSWTLVLDGKVQGSKGLSPINAPPVFAEAGNGVAYLTRDAQKNKICWIMNGKPLGLHDGSDERSFSFSADGSHWAYAVADDGQWFRVVDGKRGPLFDSVSTDFVFSPDGQRTAYSGRKGQERFLVVDGSVERKIEGLVDGTLVFSPDGKRLAYAAARPNQSCYIVVDGQAGPVFDGIGGSFPLGARRGVTSTAGGAVFGLASGCTVAFSPDSRKLAYLATKGGERVVVVDGKGDDVPMDCMVGGLLFSADSKRLAYSGRVGGRFFLVVDGKKEAEYDGVGYFGFSPDGRHVAYMAMAGGRCAVVVDGKARATYASVPAGPVFRSDGTLEFLYTDDKSLYRAEVDISPQCVEHEKSLTQLPNQVPKDIGTSAPNP